MPKCNIERSATEQVFFPTHTFTFTYFEKNPLKIEIKETGVQSQRKYFSTVSLDSPKVLFKCINLIKRTWMCRCEFLDGVKYFVLSTKI